MNPRPGKMKDFPGAGQGMLLMITRNYPAATRAVFRMLKITARNRTEQKNPISAGSTILIMTGIFFRALTGMMVLPLSVRINAGADFLPYRLPGEFHRKIS